MMSSSSSSNDRNKKSAPIYNVGRRLLCGFQNRVSSAPQPNSKTAIVLRFLCLSPSALVFKRPSVRGSQVAIAVCCGFKHCLADVAVVGSTRCANHMVATPIFLIEGITALAPSGMQTYVVRAELVGVQSCFVPETVGQVHHKLDWRPRGLLLEDLIVQTAWNFDRVLKGRDSP
jgi:hypothetical protein